MFNNAQSHNFAILGNGSDTDSRYGEQNRTAKQNLEAILDQSLISDDGKSHEKVVGHVGQANFVMQFDPCQTPRTYDDETTMGADKDGAYSTDNVIQEIDIKAKSTVEVEEDFLMMLPKLENNRHPGPGEEHQPTGDAHFTCQTMRNRCICFNWLTDKTSSAIFHRSHVWGVDDESIGRLKLKPRPDEYIELFDEAAKECILCLLCLGRLSEDLGCCNSCKILHWNELSRSRLLTVQRGHPDEIVGGTRTTFHRRFHEGH